MWILNVGLVGHDNDLDKLILGSNQAQDPIRHLLRWTRGLRTGCHWFGVIRISAALITTTTSTDILIMLTIGNKASH